MKKIITLKGVALAMFLSVSFMSQAQDQPKNFGKFRLKSNKEGIVSCATVENEKILQERNPKRATDAEFENWMAKKLQEQKDNRTPKSGNAIVTIPVVVHVIHNGDPVGQNENISDQQVFDQIRILNEDFGAMAGTPGEDLSGGLGGDTQIRFCLASEDQDGNPSNGIHRQNTGVAQYTTREAVEEMKGLTFWDPERYYNIWVVNWNLGSGGGILLGYAQFPSQSDLNGLPDNGGDEWTDGVAIKYQWFGLETGRTTTHETGHFFGLRHIWGDENGCTGNDYCADTPVAAEANSGCPEGLDSCPQAGFDMIQNYMDYTDGNCQYIFTEGQTNRMKTVLTNSPRRVNLATSTVCGTNSSQEFQFLRGTNVYPNPAQNVLNISVASGDLPDSYSIYNSLGQMVANAKVVTEANLTINTGNYSNGIYFIKIDKGNESRTIKFIKN